MRRCRAYSGLGQQSALGVGVISGSGLESALEEVVAEPGKITPAMVAKVTGKLWEMSDMVKVLVNWEAANAE